MPASDTPSIHGADPLPESSPILDALERFADLMDEVTSTITQHSNAAFDWEGRVDDIFVCRWAKVIRKWRHASRTDRPPHTLIVRLQKGLPKVLDQVCSSPKKILRRQRELQPIDRLREMDSTCLRWVTRQPGVTLEEKAGHRRSLLAIRRHESTNTLENRVVLTLLLRCDRLCREYVRQYQRKFPEHKRLREVKEFGRLCRRLLGSPYFADVFELDSVPNPNYVLLHDDRYRKLWQAYLHVTRQQRRRQQLWVNRSSLIADMLVLAIQSALSKRSAVDEHHKYALRFDVALKTSGRGGAYFEWDYPPPIWKVDDRFVYFGPVKNSPLARSMRKATEQSEGLLASHSNSAESLGQSKFSYVTQGGISFQGEGENVSACLRFVPLGEAQPKSIRFRVNLYESPEAIEQLLQDLGMVDAVTPLLTPPEADALSRIAERAPTIKEVLPTQDPLVAPSEVQAFTNDWIDEVLTSDNYRRQKAKLTRGAPLESQVRHFLESLDGRGGKMTGVALAACIGLPHARLHGLTSKIQRLLNIDSYEAVRLDRNSDTIELNKQLLQRQFGKS